MEEMDDMEIEDMVREKIADGWIQARAFIEVMAVKKDVTEKALKKHIDKLKSKKGIKVYKVDYDAVEKVDNPPKKAREAFSQIVEIEFLVPSVKSLIQFAFTYGPSSVEVIKPSSVNLKLGELQDIVNTVSAVIHQYASQSAGGIVTSPD